MALDRSGTPRRTQWRYVELPTKDYLKWDGTLFKDERGAVKRKRPKKTESRPRKRGQGGLETKSRPGPESDGHFTRQVARESKAISTSRGGRESKSISRLTTGGGAGGSLVKKEQGKVSWSTPILELSATRGN